MNVLLVVPWDNIGGVSQVVTHVGQHLRARGHTVHLLLRGDRTRITSGVSRAGFPCYWMYMRPPLVAERRLKSIASFLTWLPFTFGSLASLVRRLRIDVVNVHYPVENSLYFALLKKLRNVHLVTSVHGADMLPNGAPPRQYSYGLRALLERSDLIIAPSEPYRAAVQQVLPTLTTPIRAVPNGVDVDELVDRAETSPTSQPPYVLSILQMVHYKGVDVLISAFASISARYPGLRLKLASDGPQRETFEQLARALGVADRVDFLGFVDRQTVVRLLHRCTCFVLPSRTNSESFGIAAAEALACDRAVIASRIGGLPALVEDGVTGLLVPPGDSRELAAAMRRLLDDPALRETLGRTGGERIRSQFTWERTGDAYERAFAALANPQSARAAAPVLATR